MENIKPIGLHNEGQSNQNHDIVTHYNKLYLSVFDLQSLVSSDVDNGLYIKSGGLYGVSNCGEGSGQYIPISPDKFEVLKPNPMYPPDYPPPPKIPDDEIKGCVEVIVTPFVPPICLFDEDDKEYKPCPPIHSSRASDFDEYQSLELDENGYTKYAFVKNGVQLTDFKYETTKEAWKDNGYTTSHSEAEDNPNLTFVFYGDTGPYGDVWTSDCWGTFGEKGNGENSLEIRSMKCNPSKKCSKGNLRNKLRQDGLWEVTSSRFLPESFMADVNGCLVCMSLVSVEAISGGSGAFGSHKGLYEAFRYPVMQPKIPNREDNLTITGEE